MSSIYISMYIYISIYIYLYIYLSIYIYIYFGILNPFSSETVKLMMAKIDTVTPLSIGFNKN